VFVLIKHIVFATFYFISEYTCGYFIVIVDMRSDLFMPLKHFSLLSYYNI